MYVNANNDYADSWAQTMAVVIGVLIAWGGFFVSTRFPEQATCASLFLTEKQGAIKPESLERLMYLAGVVWVTVLPITLYGIWNRLRRKRTTLQPDGPSRSVGRLALDGLLAAAFGGWLYVLAQHTDIPLTNIYLAVAVGAAIILLAVRRVLYRVSFPALIGWALAAIIAGFYAYVLVIPPELIATNASDRYHFEPILATVNQVAHGKTILIDATSQYGVLYPYVAAAVFAWCPLTVFNLSIFFAVLAWISFLFIYGAFCERVGYGSPYALLFFLAAVGFMHPMYITLLMLDQLKVLNVLLLFTYFQYFPLRVLWGAFFIWYASYYLRHADRIPAWIGYMLAGISALWNLDTGLVIMAAWAGMLVMRQVFMLDRWRFAPIAKIVGRTMGAVCVTLGAAMTLYGFFAWLRSGSWPEYSRFFNYQTVFYRYGYFMLPMKPLEFWQPLILMYAVAFFYGIRRLWRRDNPAVACWYCYAALFGLGIFSYYQGRSHYQCLVGVAYPAMILAGSMFVDLLKHSMDLRFAAARHERFLKMAMLAIFLAWGAVYTAGAIPIAGRYFRQINQSLRTYPPDGLVDPGHELAPYLKANAPSIIISDWSTFLLTKYQCYSALPVSSLAIEAHLRDQIPSIQRAIDSQVAEYVIIEQCDSMWFGYLSFDAYREIAQTPKFRILQAKRHEV